MKSKSTFLLILFCLLSISCRDKETIQSDSYSITSRIKRDPSFLFPSKSMAITEITINQYIYLTLGHYDPYTLEMIPVLLEEIPDPVLVTEGEFSGTLRYDCSIKKEANWDDGKSITGYDYLFSIKIYKLDDLNINPAVRSVFRQMIDVEIDSENNKKFSVYVEDDYHLSQELVLITEVLPEHIYDSNNILRTHKLIKGLIEKPVDLDSNALQMYNTAVQFINHADCGRKVINGSGPYKVEEWLTNQHVSLVKKKDWWGQEYPDNPYMKAAADQIIFAVYPDDNSSITALKNGDLDVLGEIRGSDFDRIKQDQKVNNSFDFHNSSQLKYYFVGINNHSPILKEWEVRRALAHLFDVQKFLENQELGYGIRVPGPILPARSYFNDTLKLIDYDPDKARELISNAGWKDSNSNGIVDKNIDGKFTELSLKMLISGKTLGKNLALTLKERAKEAGIEIEIITKESKLIRKEIAERSFDLYPTGTVYGLYPEDLYQSWHSSNDFPGGSNKFGFNHPEADQIIEEIRSTKNKDRIQYLYKRIQEIIYHDQALIFLYEPSNNIIVNKKFTSKVTVKKPGYFLNHFERVN